ncbi:MAG: MFS transporter [Clostridia bacterium]|nr:MFS transporter [Clostridia bacterium]
MEDKTDLITPDPEGPQANPLWTRDFTIITLGSVVSMLGGQLAGFAMSLLVLDYTGSAFYFALYNIVYFVPYVVMPLIAGPYLDRFSRKRVIYTLDYITAALYGAFALVMHFGLLNFGLLALGTFILGVIGSVYQVAYQSFYPLLITPGNYQKAYSVASTLETLTMVMVPFSALIYNTMGMVPLLLINVVTYTIAATFERQIRHEEQYIAKRAEESAREARAGLQRFVSDFKEGMAYLASEKGLMAVAVYFLFSFLANGAGQSVTLPYFKGAFENGEYIYMLVWGGGSAARALGGIYHYRHRLPVEKKYDIALIVYISISLLGAFYLYLPIPAMMLCCVFNGLLGVTSYNIRISATQRYVPDEKKGRFNGAFNTLSMIGQLVGQFIAGVLSLHIPLRAIVTIFELICLAAAFIFVARNRESISKVYNTQD